MAYHGDVPESPDPAGEVDLRDYARRIGARWWIVAISIALAVAASYTFTITEDRRLTRGAAIVYLGQPVSPNGSPVANALSTNPLFAQTYARQPAVRDAAAQAAGLKAGALDGRVSVEFVSTAAGVRGTNVPLANVIVQGPFTVQQSAAAANALADAVVLEANRYTDAKAERVSAARDLLRERQEELRATAAATQERLAELERTPGLPAAERAALSAPLIATLQYNGSTESLLAEELTDLEVQVDYIENIEAARVVTPAKGSRVAPASRQVSLLAAIALGAAVGLVLAVVSTLIWPIRREPDVEPPPA